MTAKSRTARILLSLIVCACTENDISKTGLGDIPSVDLTKKIPVLTWENPVDIFYGTLLSETQLNAAANVPGDFTYTTQTGTKLKPGSAQALKTVFTPYDTAKYDTVSKVVKINVLQLAIPDVDGNLYHSVHLGPQVWFIENLKTTLYNDGTRIPKGKSLSTPAYCWMENDSSKYKEPYGALYNWYVVNTGKVCPTGWHVSSAAEWTSLQNYLMKNGYSLSGDPQENTVGKALASDTGWFPLSSLWHGAIGNADYPEKKKFDWLYCSSGWLL